LEELKEQDDWVPPMKHTSPSNAQTQEQADEHLQSKSPQREVPQRKSKTNHSFLRSRFQEKRAAPAAKKAVKPRERSRTMCQQQEVEPATTPHPQANFEDQEEIGLGKRFRRLNSQEFEQMIKLDDPSTAQESHQNRGLHFLQETVEKINKPAFFEDLAPPEATPDHLQLIVKNFDRNSFDFIESKAQNLWEMTTFNYNRVLANVP